MKLLKHALVVAMKELPLQKRKLNTHETDMNSPNVSVYKSKLDFQVYQ